MSERVVSGKQRDEDDAGSGSLRPRRLNEYIGQDKVKYKLQIAIQAAQSRGEPLDHVLLYGPPGLGKTTLASILAAEMAVGLRITSGPAIERAGDVVSILTNLKAGDILFIDEIHRLNRAVEEVLYPAMEDYAVDIVIGRGPAARSMRLNLPRFTLVGATTRLALMTSPLRDRFGSIERLDFYDQAAMEAIVRRSAGVLDIGIVPEAASEIARRARGTPRIANRLLRRVRDFAQVRADGIITLDVAREALDLLEVDEVGLDVVDRLILRRIIEQYDGGPVGIVTLAAATSEEADTIEDVYEPFLIKEGDRK